MITRREADIVYRNHFGAFVYAAFEALYRAPLVANWHIDAVAFEVEKIAISDGRGRLVVNLPPRSLKSFIISTCLPAWMLGRNPAARLICASYAEELAFKFSRDCRSLMETDFYKRLFPRTRLNPRKSTEAEFETTRRGYRLATSVGGALTGRGGDALIVDDPTKARDAGSEAALAAAAEWFRGTALSRLDDPKSIKIFVTMQRLHSDDLAGILIERGWPKLVLPAIATEPADYLLGASETHHRPAGELLQRNRDSSQALEELQREIGSRNFAAQYQQDPTPADGNMIKAAWLGSYDAARAAPKYRRVVVSCDPAGKAHAQSDYTAIVVAGIADKVVHVLHVARGHWTVMQMRARIVELAAEWKPTLVIIEDTASGTGLIQLLGEQKALSVIGRHPSGDKETRLARHQGRFEALRILLPTDAPWKAEFVRELLAFPNGRNDDQLDALLQILDWLSENERYFEIPIVPPIVTTRRSLGLPSLRMDWSDCNL
jgi:predicted phage terminase large subunit-like protein